MNKDELNVLLSPYKINLWGDKLIKNMKKILKENVKNEPSRCITRPTNPEEIIYRPFIRKTSCSLFARLYGSDGDLYSGVYSGDISIESHNQKVRNEKWTRFQLSVRGGAEWGMFFTSKNGRQLFISKKDIIHLTFSIENTFNLENFLIGLMSQNKKWKKSLTKYMLETSKDLVLNYEFMTVNGLKIMIKTNLSESDYITQPLMGERCRNLLWDTLKYLTLYTGLPHSFHDYATIYDYENRLIDIATITSILENHSTEFQSLL